MIVRNNSIGPKKGQEGGRKVRNALLCTALLPFLIGTIYFVFKKNDVYESAPIIAYEAKKGDRLEDWFKSENTKKNLDFEKYEQAILALNEYNYKNEDAWPEIKYRNIKKGNVYNLLDLNKDGHVGKIRKVDNYNNFRK